MPSFKQPSFQERTALAADAKKAALAKLLAKPAVDDAVLAERRAVADAREAAQQVVRAEKLAARELEKVQKKEAAAAKAAAPAITEAEQKNIRDAKYAARKNRVGKR